MYVHILCQGMNFTNEIKKVFKFQLFEHWIREYQFVAIAADDG